jgi:hypothetical protein
VGFGVAVGEPIAAAIVGVGVAVPATGVPSSPSDSQIARRTATTRRATIAAPASGRMGGIDGRFGEVAGPPKEPDVGGDQLQAEPLEPRRPTMLK